MVLRKGFLLPVCVAIALARCTASGEGTGAAMPDELSDYRRWEQLVKGPHPVPLEMYMRCAAPAPEEWREAEKRYGPHTRRLVRVYGNESAADAFVAKRRLPVGSVVVKEKLLDRAHETADGVAFMIKRAGPNFAQSGGWEFLYFAPSGEKQVAHDGCVSCHAAAKATDYVFGKYPRE